MRTLASSAVDAAFAALAHPVRRQILVRLAEGEAMATELGKPFALTQPAVSHHSRLDEPYSTREERDP